MKAIFHAPQQWDAVSINPVHSRTLICSTLSSLLAINLALAMTIARGDEGDGLQTLQEVIVEGQWENNLVAPQENQPNTATTITKKGIDILAGPAQTNPYQTLGLIPSVNVEGVDAFGLTVDQSFIRIRGQSGYTFSNLASTVEGIPSTVNVGQAAIGNLYDLENVSTTTLLRGPIPPDKGLGFGDIAGAMDLTLLRPRDSFGATLKGGIGSDHFNRAFLRVDSGLLPTGTKVFGSVSYSDVDKWRGSGEIERTNGNIGLVQTISDRAKLEIFGAANQFKRNEYRPLTYAQASHLDQFYKFDYNADLTGDPARDVSYYKFNRQQFDEYNLFANLELKPTNTGRLSIKPYYLSDSGERYSGNANVAGSPGVLKFDISQNQYGVVAQYDDRIADNDLTVGYWFQNIETIPPVKSQKAYRITSDGGLRFDRWVILAKVEDRVINSPFISIGRQWDDVYLKAGVRYLNTAAPKVQGYNTTNLPDVSYDDVFNYNPQANSALSADEIEFSEFLPYIGADYALRKDTHLRLAYGRTYGYPFQGPLYSTYVNNLAKFQAAGVTLQSLWDKLNLELADNFDLGLRFDQQGWYVAPTLYYAKYHDKQVNVFDPKVGLNYYQSAAETTSYGAELEFGANPLSNLSLFAGISYNHFTFDDDISTSTGAVVSVKGNQITDTPKFMAKLGLTYQLYNVSITPTIRYIGERFGDVNNTQHIPSYAVTDLHINYEGGKMWGLSDFKADLALLNLFDRNYIGIIQADERDLLGSTPSYYPGAPFTMAFTLMGRF